MLHHPVYVRRRCKMGHIHFWMKCVYDNDSSQSTAVFDWYKRFREGRNSTEDLACLIRWLHILDLDTCAKEDQMVQVDHHVMLWHQRWMCASHHHASSWVSEGICIMVAKELKWRKESNSYGCLLGTSAAAWRRRRQGFWSMLSEGISPGVCTVIQWPNAWVSSGNFCPSPDRKRVVMLTLFLDHYGPLLIDWLPMVITVSTDLCSGTLECSKSPSMISHGIILIYDNARPKSAWTSY